MPATSYSPPNPAARLGRRGSHHPSDDETNCAEIRPELCRVTLMRSHRSEMRDPGRSVSLQVSKPGLDLREWRPQRDSNPCCRIERPFEALHTNLHRFVRSDKSPVFMRVRKQCNITLLHIALYRFLRPRVPTASPLSALRSPRTNDPR